MSDSELVKNIQTSFPETRDARSIEITTDSKGNQTVQFYTKSGALITDYGKYGINENGRPVRYIGRDD